MKKDMTPPETVTAYIAEFPRPTRAILRRVRAAIRKALPRADETIWYRIPTYKLHGRPVIYFAGWKRHFSIYPATARLVAAFEDELAPYEVNDKGTIRFPLTAPVPTALIGRLAAFRASEVGAPAARVRRR